MLGGAGLDALPDDTFHHSSCFSRMQPRRFVEVVQNTPLTSWQGAFKHVAIVP